MSTSSLASFLRRKPCTSRFAVLCRWPTITQVYDVELFRWRRKWLNADQYLPSSAVQASPGRMWPWILAKRTQVAAYFMYVANHIGIMWAIVQHITPTKDLLEGDLDQRTRVWPCSESTSLAIGKLTLEQQSTFLHGSIHGASVLLIS